MEDILQIIDNRKRYVFLILSKIYIRTKGRTDEGMWEIEIETEMKKLLESDFNDVYFSVAIQYCISENYIQGYSYGLTTYGRRYFDDLILSLQNASEEEKKILKQKLPEKILKYLEISSHAATLMSFLVQLRSF